MLYMTFLNYFNLVFGNPWKMRWQSSSYRNSYCWKGQKRRQNTESLSKHSLFEYLDSLTSAKTIKYQTVIYIKISSPLRSLLPNCRLIEALLVSKSDRFYLVRINYIQSIPPTSLSLVILCGQNRPDIIDSDHIIKCSKTSDFM